MRDEISTTAQSAPRLSNERRPTALRDTIAGGFRFKPAQAATDHENRAHEAGPL